MAQPFAQLDHPAGATAPGRVRLQQDCPACGFHNLEMDLRCQKCGRRLPLAAPPVAANAAPAPAASPDASAAAPVAAPAVVAPLNAPPAAPQRPVMPEHVRAEIHSKVERFRARRRGQTLPLPFEEPVLPESENVVPFPTLEPEPKIIRRRADRESAKIVTGPPAAVEVPPVETVIAPSAAAASEAPADSISAGPAEQNESPALPPFAVTEQVPRAAPTAASEPWPPVRTAQPEVAEPADRAEQAPFAFSHDEAEPPRWQALPIAPLGRRLSGVGHDLARIGAGIALFAAPFYWIAGKPPLNLLLLAGFLCGSLLLALLYGILFLAVFSQTPGMSAAGLRVVSFDGRPATLRQRMLRVGGALVSSGSFLFGYAWAIVDEEKLYWHDHISKTFLTDARP